MVFLLNWGKLRHEQWAMSDNTWAVSDNTWTMMPNLVNEDGLRTHILKLVRTLFQLLNCKVLAFWLNKSKGSRTAFVVKVRWSVNELVTIVIRLAQKSKHIIKMFAMHPCNCVTTHCNAPLQCPFFPKECKVVALRMLQSQQWRFEHHVPISRESANTTSGSLYCKYELPSPPPPTVPPSW